MENPTIKNALKVFRDKRCFLSTLPLTMIVGVALRDEQRGTVEIGNLKRRPQVADVDPDAKEAVRCIGKDLVEGRKDLLSAVAEIRTRITVFESVVIVTQRRKIDKRDMSTRVVVGLYHMKPCGKLSQSPVFVKSLLLS